MDGYALTFACFLLSAGNLGDKAGAKTIFLWGLVLFTLTSLGCGISNTLWLLTAFRLLQGTSAALLVPTSLALINASYENNQERAKAIGIWASIGGIAALLGPILGAILTNWFGWRAVFFVNIPIGITAILLSLRYVPNPTSCGSTQKFDLPGQIISILSIAALAFSLIEAGRVGWLSPLVITTFGIFLVTFIAFLMIEHRATSPMFPLKFFRSSTFAAAIAVGMLLNTGIFGLLFILPLYFQQVRGYSVLMTGLALLPLVGLAAIVSYLGGKMVSIVGPRQPMIIGLAIGTVGFLAMLITGEHTPPYFMLILPLISIGAGMAFAMPAVTVATIHSAPQERAGIASGALNASRQVGSLLGIAIFGTIINTTKNFITGMHSTLLIGGIIFLGGCIVTLVYIKREEGVAE